MVGRGVNEREGDIEGGQTRCFSEGCTEEECGLSEGRCNPSMRQVQRPPWPFFAHLTSFSAFPLPPATFSQSAHLLALCGSLLGYAQRPNATDVMLGHVQVCPNSFVSCAVTSNGSSLAGACGCSRALLGCLEAAHCRDSATASAVSIV